MSPSAEYKQLILLNQDQQQFHYIYFMWTNLNQFCYETFLLNCYHSSLAFPFAQLSYQPCPFVNSFPQNQQALGSAQKSYRETVQEIEQKTSKRTQNGRKKKVQKSRFIIKKEREDNFERKKQKKDRNLPSNICKYFVSYLYHHPCPSSILQNLNKPSALEHINSCISKVKSHIKENQTYIRPGIIESMCRTALLGLQEAKILRIIFKKFMGCEFRAIVSMMRKLTKKEKVAYFRMGRKFVKKFTGRL